MFIPNGPRLGDKVIEAHDVSKAFGERLLFEGLEFTLPPNGIVGVIGPNGAGKTTLFRMIMGQEEVDREPFRWVKPLRSAMWIRPTPKLTRRKLFTRWCPAVMKPYGWGDVTSTCVLFCLVLILPVPIRKKNVVRFREESAIACIWP